MSHDVSLTLFVDDGDHCATFIPLVKEQAARLCLPIQCIRIADDPDRAAMCGVTDAPTLVAKIEGIPVAHIGDEDTPTLVDFLTSLDVVEV